MPASPPHPSSFAPAVTYRRLHGATERQGTTFGSRLTVAGERPIDFLLVVKRRFDGLGARGVCPVGGAGGWF